MGITRNLTAALDFPTLGEKLGESHIASKQNQDGKHCFFIELILPLKANFCWLSSCQYCQKCTVQFGEEMFIIMNISASQSVLVLMMSAKRNYSLKVPLKVLHHEFQFVWFNEFYSRHPIDTYFPNMISCFIMPVKQTHILKLSLKVLSHEFHFIWIDELYSRPPRDVYYVP